MAAAAAGGLVVSPWLLVLAPALAFGWTSARRLFREADPLAALVGAVSLALAGLLLGVDLLLPWLDMHLSLLLAGGVLGVAAAANALTPADPLVRPREHLGIWAVLAGFLAATLAWGIYALADAQVIEGDFFIHAAQFGLFQSGWFPPQHPFYPDTPLHGHYGRPLLVAVAAAASGMRDLTAEWVVTLLLQALTLLLVFTAFRRASGSLVGLGAAGFAFFAVNVGYRAGLMDTLQNHNAAAWFFVALGAWCVLPVLTGSLGGGAAAVAGAMLGASQFVYETNFGLQWLSLLAVGLACRVPRRPLAVVLVVSLLLTLFEGGVVTASLQKRLGLGAPVVAERQAAGQEVQIGIPKARFLQVRLSNLTPARPFDTKFRPWKPEVKPTDDYAYLWDPRFFSGFWLTAWLAPVALVFLWRRRDVGGLWFAAFGFLAVLVPATVDFGPVFEHETFRWLFASGLGLAVAWGVMLPRWVQERPVWWRILLALFLTWYCFLGAHKCLTGMQEAYRNPREPHPTGLPAFMPDAPYLPDPYGQLAYQYKVTPADLEAARFLRDQGGSFAANLPDWSANPKGALVGEARMPMYGHYYPLEDRDLRPPMYSLSPQSLVFWAFGREDLLQALGVDWLFVGPGYQAPTFLGEPAVQIEGRRVYRVPEALREPIDVGAGNPGLRIEGRVPAALEPGTAGVGTLRIANETGAPVNSHWWSSTYLRHKERGIVVNPSDPLRQRIQVDLAPGETVEVPWFVAAPYAGGDYLVEGPVTVTPPVLTVRPVTDEERFRNESAAPAGWR